MATASAAVEPEARAVTAWADSELLREAAIAPLEAFEATQSATAGVYNARCSRALLRLYAMFPTKAKKDVALRILAKVRAGRWRPLSDGHQPASRHTAAC